MELDSTWPIILSALLIGYAFVYGLFKKFNELYYVGRFRRNSNSKYPLPPGDMGWPLLGNIFTFLRAFKSGDPDSIINDLVSRFGRTGIYKVHLFGSPSIIVCAPDSYKKVMSDEEKFKLGYPKATILLMGRRGFHNISNAEHRRLRRLTTSPVIGHEALTVYMQCIEGIHVNFLEEWSSSDRPVELLAELRKVSFKAVANIIGVRLDSMIPELLELYADLEKGMKSPVINIPGFAFHRALQARKKLVQIFKTALDEKRDRIRDEGDERKKDILDLFMGANDEEGNQLEDQDIADLLLFFLLAGHESAAHATTWSVIYLTQHPEILAQAKREQEEVIKRRPSTQKGLTIKEIKQMPYLSKVIDETLRITNLSFVNIREANVDVHINGYTIPKGWKVLNWSRAIHMDPHIYPNPLKFDPERWDNHVPKPGQFVPFGMGSRLCPGADLAKLEIAMFLHHFLLHYKIERLNPTAPVVFLPVPSPSDNCLARVIKLDP